MTIDRETEAELRKLAEAQGGRSVSSVVREAIKAYLPEPELPKRKGARSAR